MLIKKKHKLIILAVILFILGCVTQQELEIYKRRPIKFSHITHCVTKEKWKCEACHKGSQEEEEAGDTHPRLCRKCHQTKKEIEKFLRPFAPGKKLLWTDVTRLREEVIFSHELHYKKEVKCEDCHKNLLNIDEVTTGARVEKVECIDCHARENVSGECKVCHKNINKKWKPPDHLQNWKKFHGQTVKAGPDEPFKNQCSLCHTESTCTSCHQDEKPTSHNTFWRYKGHGISAGMDRSDCATCHQTYFCESCHKETSPRNHVGSWGNPRNRHCMTCHFTAQPAGCNVCHKNNNGHLDARSLPGNITHQTAGAYECKTCHTKLGNLKHFDNGDDCRFCHK